MKKFYKLLLMYVGNKLPLSYHPFGRLSNKFRVFCARRIVLSMGKGGNIEKGAILQTTNIIGERTAIGVNCVLSEQVQVGDGVMMGPECLIYTSNHKFNKQTGKYKGSTDIQPVIIGNYAWLGARVIILPGVKIGEGATIGAGSIVTKDIPAYTVAVGNPARVVKNLLN